jgi:hypothetical protein
METVGLRSISHYVEVHRQHISNYIFNRPIFNACRDGVRRWGSSHRQFWWDQPLSLTDDPPAGVDDDDDEDGSSELAGEQSTRVSIVVVELILINSST